jgi:glycosyltransferase involved in cell wall biosynthesis
MKVSVITVCFNECQRIEATILSVLNQTARESIEYIVIDGGSTDGTVQVLKKYLGKVEYLVSEPDRGIYHAMNKGAAVATGDYLLFINGGDYLCGENVVWDFIKAGPRKDLVHGFIMTELGRKMKDLAGVRVREYLRSATLPHQATFIRRTLFQRCGGYAEEFRIAGDYNFFVTAVFEHRATTESINLAVSYFNLEGISNREIDVVSKEKSIVRGRLPKRSLMDRAARGISLLKRKLLQLIG